MDNSKLQNLFSKLEESKNDRETSIEEKIDKLVSDYVSNQETDIDFRDSVSARFFLIAQMLYLYYEAPDDEQNMFMIAELVNASIKREGQEEYESDLDRLFGMLKEKNSSHLALEYYNRYLSSSKNREKEIVNCLKKILYPIVCVEDDLLEVLKSKYHGLKSDEDIKAVSQDYAYILDSNFNNGEFQKDENKEKMKDEIEELYSIFKEFIKNATDVEKRTIRHLEDRKNTSTLLLMANVFFRGCE